MEKDIDRILITGGAGFLGSHLSEALLAKEEGKEKVILFNLSGHGHVDMAAYDAYFNNELQDYEYPEAAITESLSHLPEVD